MTSVHRSIATARKKYEEIAEHLELLIFSGKLSSGDKCPSERDLMTKFGAGRSSVREALFALRRKGLLSVRPGAAARVSKPNTHTMISELSGAVRHMLARPEGIRDLQSARALFEIGLARHAALHASEEDILELGKALEDNLRAVDQETFSSTDMIFHYTLAMISHNEVFTSLNTALTGWLQEQRKVSAQAGATFSEVYLQHKAIYDAIVAKNPVAAQAAMATHLDFVAERYWREVTHTRASR